MSLEAGFACLWYHPCLVCSLASCLWLKMGALSFLLLQSCLLPAVTPPHHDGLLPAVTISQDKFFHKLTLVVVFYSSEEE